MIFIYRISISIHYEAEKADCLNGSTHDWHPTFTRPIKYTEGECKVCGVRRKATFEDMQYALDYQKLLKMEIMESTDEIDESLYKSIRIVTRYK
jgi:hypothetical protein